MKRSLTVLLAATLTACATVPATATKEEMAAFQAGNAAVLIASAQDDMSCWHTDLGFRREGSTFGVVRRAYYRSPIVAVVPPGRYHLASAMCEGYNWSAVFPNVHLWFGPVDLQAGEVVYVGALKTDMVDVQALMSPAERAWTLGLSALWGNATTHQYPTYELTDASEHARKELRSDFPELADRMTVRRPVQYLTRERLAQAYRNAYARNDDGSLPTQEQARARLAAELEAAFAQSAQDHLQRQTGN